MFHVWPQIEHISRLGKTPLDLALACDPHTLRYLLVYPFLYLADELGLHKDFFYTLFVYGCWIGSVYLSCSIVRRSKIHAPYMHYLFVFLIMSYLIGIPFANGRGILATFGVMLLFFIQSRWKELALGKKVLGLGFSFLLCSVSTGIVFCFCVSVSLLIVMNFQIKKLSNTVFLGAVFYVIILCGYVSFEKNFAYFGSIVAMLEHGLPGIFPSPLLKWGMVTMILSLAYFTYHILCREFGKNIIVIIPFILGGLFGRLTFFVVVPVLLTSFIVYYTKNIGFIKQRMFYDLKRFTSSWLT